jgi:fatty-acid desaturase
MCPAGSCAISRARLLGANDYLFSHSRFENLPKSVSVSLATNFGLNVTCSNSLHSLTILNKYSFPGVIVYVAAPSEFGSHQRREGEFMKQPLGNEIAPQFAAATGRRALERPAGVMAPIRWRYALPILVLHLLALLAFVPWLFSWSGLVLFAVGFHVFGTGVNVGYHRLLAHGAFKCPAWVERTFVMLAVCCMEDAPATWVATHRLHHKDSDERPDPHSPRASFWWSHLGWLLRENSDVSSLNTLHRCARDLLKQPFYRWLQRGYTVMWIYLAHAAVFFSAGFLVSWISGGSRGESLQLASSWLVWGVILRTVAVWHITWSVNSLSHVFGYQSYRTGDDSRNNWLVALFTSGEGWHNNHHIDPTSASNWHRWWEVDAMYLVIKGLEKVGLATDVVPIRRGRRVD